MASKPPVERTKAPVGKKTLIGVVGAAAAAIMVPMIIADEGTEYVGYLDIIGVPTKCTGDTNDVKVGKIYTKAECDASLERQIIAHAEPAIRCTPIIKSKPEVLASVVGITYNIGTSGYCNSSIARNFNAGNFRKACDSFLAWDKTIVARPIKGQVCVKRKDGRYTCQIRGLTLRRQREHKLCLKGLA